MDYRIETRDANNKIMYVDISHLLNVNAELHYPNEHLYQADFLGGFHSDYIQIHNIACKEQFQRQGFTSILFNTVIEYIKFYYDNTKLKYMRGWLSPRDIPNWHKSIPFYISMLEKNKDVFEDFVIYKKSSPDIMYTKDYVLNHINDFAESGLNFKYIFLQKELQCSQYNKELFLNSVRQTSDG